MGLWGETNRRWGERINKALRDVESTLAESSGKKTSQNIVAHAGMAERLVRDLVIEEALQEEIKDRLEHNNKSYGEWCAQTDRGKRQHLFSLALYDSINDMKLVRNVCITPQPCHSHFCC